MEFRALKKLAVMPAFVVLFSHLFTAGVVMPNLFAISSCVIPASFLYFFNGEKP
jgi:hypothetical protein